MLPPIIPRQTLLDICTQDHPSVPRFTSMQWELGRATVNILLIHIRPAFVLLRPRISAHHAKASSRRRPWSHTCGIRHSDSYAIARHSRIVWSISKRSDSGKADPKPDGDGRRNGGQAPPPLWDFRRSNLKRPPHYRSYGGRTARAQSSIR